MSRIKDRRASTVLAESLLIAMVMLAGSAVYACYSGVMSSTSNVITSFTSKMDQGAAVKSIQVEVYGDGNCSQKLSSVDWGMVEPGYTKNASIYVKNEGSNPTYLVITTENWSPPTAQTYVTFNSDYAGQTIPPYEVFQVTLTLSVSTEATAVTNFSFDIIITGNEIS